MLIKIISGGQTGADQGALHGARLAGIKTGGTAPKGWETERGPNSNTLMRYGLVECSVKGYPARTRINVWESNGTLIFGDRSGRGSALTIRYCEQLNKPYRIVTWRASKIEEDTVQSAVRWIRLNLIRVLNVAGNRESRNRGIQTAVRDFIIRLIKEQEKGRDNG